ncbi:MAG: type II toxin-antitoxin system Phd/YefM family antitoxin [Opitutus sp.]|nr:type II toxin-antitoxin system Phd/YefM family antitoxin [Opitutus sp.]
MSLKPAARRLVIMKETTLTFAEAGPHFGRWVKRARAENMSFVVVTDGVPVARLVPESDRRCTGRTLALAVARTRLSPRAASAWHGEWSAARAALRAPEDKWR